MTRQYRQHHVTVYVPRDLLDTVDIYCHEHELNRSQFTRNAWKYYLKACEGVLLK